MTIGHLVYRLPTGPLVLPITGIQLRQRRVVITARVEVWPGQPDVSIPAGRWPCTLLGADGLAIYSSIASFAGSRTRGGDGAASHPSTFTVVQPFGDPDMQSPEAGPEDA
jgi:hypothetical protein